MSTRPAIPLAIQKEVLFEARHRCAVCCDPTPLERAHIRPWSKSKDHSVSNLIALCANCHGRADTEKWGVDYLRKYKMRLIRFGGHVPKGGYDVPDAIRQWGPASPPAILR